MRKSIFSALVVMLAGACWVLAQNASTNRSPYGAQTAPVTSPGPMVAPIPVRAPVPQALTPVERAERLVSEPAVAPTTELDFPSIPALPDLPALPTVPASSRPIPEAPPSTLPVAQPPMMAIPAMPQPELPPLMTGNQMPFGNPTLPQPVPQYFPQPNSPEPGLQYLPQPNLPQPTIVEERPAIRANTTPAVPGLPPLPPIPGITNSTPPGIPTYVGPAAQGNGQPVFVPSPTGNSNGIGPAPWQPPAIWTDNDPAYWNGRQPIVDEQSRQLGPKIWASADYLLWLVKSGNSPALVQGIRGVQGGGAQMVDLYPAGKIDYGTLNGVRGTFGFWLNGSQTLGLETSYMWLGTTSVGETFVSSPSLILGRPFFNANTGGNAFFQLSSPNGTAGAVAVRNSLHVEGGEANFLLNSMSIGPRLNLLAGFRYLDISENLRVNDVSVNSATGFAASSFDSFGTLNQFFGGQIGLRWGFQGERLSTSFTGKIAYGAMLEHVRIDGGTSVSTPNAGTATASGGILALPTNIGSYNRTQGTFIPEAIANVGYRLTPWATMSVGYNFMYVHNLVRPGAQIDPAVNPQNFPFGSGSASATHPGFQYRSEDLWLQGINFSMMFTY